MSEAALGVENSAITELTCLSPLLMFECKMRRPENVQMINFHSKMAKTNYNSLHPYLQLFHSSKTIFLSCPTNCTNPTNFILIKDQNLHSHSCIEKCFWTFREP